MSESPLSNHAGPIVIASGGLLAVAHLGQFLFFDPSDLITTEASLGFRVFSAAYAMAFPLLSIALVTLYLRQAAQAGRFGAVAFCTALIGTVGLAGDEYYEGFAAPWLVGVAPVLVEVEHGTVLVAAWFVSVVLFALGWFLFGLASYRTEAFPRAACVGLMIGGLLGYFAAQPPWGLALGLAVAAVGVCLVRTDRLGPGGLGTAVAERTALAPAVSGSST